MWEIKKMQDDPFALESIWLFTVNIVEKLFSGLQASKGNQEFVKLLLTQ